MIKVVELRHPIFCCCSGKALLRRISRQGKKAVFDFQGNILRGDLGSKTAVKLVREWVDLRVSELETDWMLAMKGQEINKIEPLN